MVIIKVNEVPNSKEGLKERVRKAWKMDQGRLYNQQDLAAVYRGEILEVYKILGYAADEEHTDRVAFQLEEINSYLKGKKIAYPTANPATICDIHALKIVE
ncbi:hypothetical protein [Paenibacillus montanisoli]|uniref:ASCH domain-containing protein n=1 Tax=Paenibacillus montanisoli TaxID=2081970 RepID=A0A328TV33_9BACL|nr:hypothetical protein [Paenibacillus montanisoli]RAP74387.1 hypothetical protein DL346_20105 [Paenibacillus montanisoli]